MTDPSTGPHGSKCCKTPLAQGTRVSASQGAEVSPEPESLLDSLVFKKKRKGNPHKSAIHCDLITVVVSEALVALDKLIRIKLIILASLQH